MRSFDESELDSSLKGENLRYELKDLETIQAQVKASDTLHNELKGLRLNLKELLERQELKLREFEADELENISIKVEVNTPENEVLNDCIINSKPDFKHYNIKSLMLEWEGKPSYMHVFIDTTNIIYLEEAQNSIK